MNTVLIRLSIAIFKGIMRFLYIFIRLCPARDKVTLLSRESDEPSIDFAMLEESLCGKGVEVAVLTRRMGGGPCGYIRYFFHMLRQMYHIATSRVVVLDTYCIAASVLRHKRSLKIIQIWHAAAALKKFGYQTIGKSGGTSELVAAAMNMHGNYDCVTAPSEVTARTFAEAFNVPASSVYRFGLPRLQYIAESVPAMSRELRARYGLEDEERRVLLYAPTYRRRVATAVSSFLDCVDSSRYFVIAALHPLERAVPEIPGTDDFMILQGADSFELLSLADLVVSDYSSFIVEASLADKPIYIYAYDYCDYLESTGLNVDWSREAISDYFYTEAGELAEGLGGDYDMDKLRTFREKYIDVDCKDCTDKLSEFIISFI